MCPPKSCVYFLVVANVVQSSQDFLALQSAQAQAVLERGKRTQWLARLAANVVLVATGQRRRLPGRERKGLRRRSRRLHIEAHQRGPPGAGRRRGRLQDIRTGGGIVLGRKAKGDQRGFSGRAASPLMSRETPFPSLVALVYYTFHPLASRRHRSQASLSACPGGGPLLLLLSGPFLAWLIPLSSLSCRRGRRLP